MSRTILLDGNYYLHRAFSVAVSKRNPVHIEKNTLTLFLNLVCSDIVSLRGTHALVVFDSPNCFRLEIYKQYKANRRTGETTTDVTLRDGSTITVEATAGSMVKSARKLVDYAGLTHAYKPGYEGDDLLACATNSLEGDMVVCGRDKDSATLVNPRVKQYWPQEKKLFGPKEVKEHWGVHPHQMRDYLCLLGDKVDNIPGIPGLGPKTAVKILESLGSISEALKDPKWGPKLKEHKKTLILARRLVTLRADIGFKLEDLVIDEVDQRLLPLVWEIPKSLKDLGEARKASKMKGLFS